MSIGRNYLAAVVASRSVSALRHAEAEHFVDDEESAIYEYLVNHLESYGEVASADAVYEQTGYDLPEIEDSVDYHWTNLVERRFYNDIRDPFNDLRRAIGNNEMGEARTLIGRISTLAMSNEVRVDLLPASEVGRLTLERYRQNHMMPGITGVPSGFGSIDVDTGGYQGGDLVMWVARPGMGKTWILLAQALAAARAGFNVLFVTMEMGLVQIGTRFYGMVAGINPRLIRDGRLGTRTERRLAAATGEFNDNHRLFFYSGNMGQSTTALNAVLVERNPDIVFVDGVYFMRSPSADRNANRNSHVAYAIDDLKRIALARNIPVVATTQFSRDSGAGGRRGSLETIAYTDAISTHASLIYMLQRPHARAVNQRTLLINTAKGREGEAANLAIKFEFAPPCFDETDMAQALDPQDQGEVNLDWMRQ